MTNDQVLVDIEERLAEGRVVDQVVYYTKDQEQLELIEDAAQVTGCVLVVLGPDDGGEATVLVDGSPQQLKQCVQDIGRRLSSDGD